MATETGLRLAAAIKADSDLEVTLTYEEMVAPMLAGL
jgi:hypothetical protein